MKGSMVLGIVVAAIGFLLWAGSYIYFRLCIKPLKLSNCKESDPRLTDAQKRKLRTYNSMLAISCILAVAGCMITLIVRFL